MNNTSKDIEIKDKLTPKQIKLVDTIVTTGCSVTEAGKLAGYSSSNNKESARVIASKTLRLPKVQKYMLQLIAKTLGVGAGIASSKLINLATNAKSEYVQLQSCIDILDRTGFKAPEKHQHQVIGDVKVNINLD